VIKENIKISMMTFQEYLSKSIHGYYKFYCNHCHKEGQNGVIKNGKFFCSNEHAVFNELKEEIK